MEKDEVVWTKISFESKSHTIKPRYMVRKVMAILGNTAKILTLEKKTLDYLMIHSTSRIHEDLEFLVPRCSAESHTSTNS